MSFDPYTGQPLAPQPRFDPNTGQPLAPQPRFDPNTGQPIAQPQAPTAAVMGQRDGSVAPAGGEAAKGSIHAKDLEGCWFGCSPLIGFTIIWCTKQKAVDPNTIHESGLLCISCTVPASISERRGRKYETNDFYLIKEKKTLNWLARAKSDTETQIIEEENVTSYQNSCCATNAIFLQCRIC